MVWVRQSRRNRYRNGATACSVLLPATCAWVALQPVPNAGGSEAIAHRSRAPAGAGRARYPAPRAFSAESAGGLMFTHIGEHTLLHHIENSPKRLDYWQQGLASHRAGAPQRPIPEPSLARNIIVCERQPKSALSTLKTIPGRYMPLERCQSRDYLCYLQSSAVWLQKHGLLDQAAAIWRQHAAACPPPCARPYESAIRPIGWMRHLQAGFWGNDALRLAALAALFEQAKSRRYAAQARLARNGVGVCLKYHAV